MSFLLALLLGSENLLLIKDPTIFMYGCFNSIWDSRFCYLWPIYLGALHNRKYPFNLNKGVLVGSSALALFILVSGANIQLTTPFIYALVLVLSTGGTRFVVRRLFLNPNEIVKKPTIIYGAGEAGRELQNTLLYNHEIKPVALSTMIQKFRG